MIVGTAQSKIGDEVYSLTHGMAGTIEGIVPAPDDMHHAPYFDVRLEDGRLVHLVLEPSKQSNE